ncbi:MAG: hypothetical protein IPJ47_20290 [Anaerolineales bacterium]|nr:hypothetical protein [Anaerolineales bacterium]
MAFLEIAFTFDAELEDVLRVVLTFNAPFLTVAFIFTAAFTFDFGLILDLTAIIHFLTHKN